MSMNSPHESVKDIVSGLWKNNRPLLIAGAVALMAVIYVVYKKQQASSAAAVATPDMTGTGATITNYYSSTTTTQDGTPVAPVAMPVTVATPVTTTGGGIVVTSPVSTLPKPVSAPVAAPVKNKPTPTNTYVVQHWPAQGSTLFGIAQIKYGNGAQWPKIYAANKSIIGSNPNLIRAGQVLVIPK